MADNSNKPKWLKRLKKLMKSEDEADHQALKEALEKLKLKANDLKGKIDDATTEQEREELIAKLELVNKHRKKGMKRLLGEQ